MKVITYNEYGGYYVPNKIICEYYDINSYEITEDIKWDSHNIPRNDLKLCELFEKYKYTDFKINVIPDHSYRWSPVHSPAASLNRPPAAMIIRQNSRISPVVIPGRIPQSNVR